jgi:hypothetical protein
VWRFVSSVRRYGIDFNRGHGMVQFPDGTLQTIPIPAELVPEYVGLKRLVYDTMSSELSVTLLEGDKVELEVARPGAPTPSPRRPVVYLDQLHWVELAKQQWTPEKVPPRNREATSRLIELARRRKITLPISAGNLTEMTQLDGRRRRHMATIMLELSRGWQMRSPMAVRSAELRSALEGKKPTEQVFSLEPGALFADDLEPAKVPADFPHEWQMLFKSMTALNATVAMMMRDEKSISEKGRGMAEAWAKSHHDLAVYMRNQRMPKERIRLNARAKLIADLGSEIEAAARDSGTTQGELLEWLEERFEPDLAGMPYLGRQHQVIYQRLRNANDQWERNDLIDVNFLSCAAGYADVVVAETKLGTYLKRAQKQVPEGAFVCLRLSEAVEHLEIHSGHTATPAAAN